jgi:predicted ATPase
MLYDENMKKQAQLSSILVHNRTHFDFQWQCCAAQIQCCKNLNLSAVHLYFYMYVRSTYPNWDQNLWKKTFSCIYDII